MQLLLPLRHWLYPGDVAWTEEGRNFAWRMKLTQKDNATEFLVTFPDGKIWPVRLDEFLTRWQEDKMAGDPELILQFAHYLARTLPGPIQVHVDTNTSLNGHAPQPLVDPEVDLAKEPRRFWPAPWILPRKD